jgi:hypothetical protein
MRDFSLWARGKTGRSTEKSEASHRDGKSRSLLLVIEGKEAMEGRNRWGSCEQKCFPLVQGTDRWQN